MSDSISSSMPDELILAIATGKPVPIEDITCLGIDINASGANNSRTALAAAAFAGNSNLIKALVNSGADLHHRDPYGSTAIHEAASMGRDDAVRTLLDLGADIEATTSHGHTALMLAAAWGNCDVVRFLLDRGADTYRHDYRGDTALMIAEEKEEEETAAILRSNQDGRPNHCGTPDTGREIS